MRDLEKTALITGATTGIGRATAAALAGMGMTVVFTTRDKDRGEAARQYIMEQGSNDEVYALDCDLASLKSVKACTGEFKSRFDKLHLLINNAGTWNTKRQVSADGYEHTLAVNHLSHFLLTNELLDIIKASAPSRIVNLSSGAHYMGKLDLDDLQLEKKYSGIRAYGNSKLANILFTRELSRRLSGSGVTVNAVHPGFVGTDLGRNFGRITNWLYKKLGMTSEKGARTSLYAATSEEMADVHGEYLAKCRITRTSERSKDMELAGKLWQISEELIKAKLA